MSEAKEINFETLLATTVKLPMVKISRDKFLQAELTPYCKEDVIQNAIDDCPAAAGIPKEIIDKIALSCIKYETRKVSALSFVAGLPGGLAMLGTVPADLAQYMGHVLRILQKLAYLYGWQDLIDGENELNDETNSILTLFVGVMFGVNGANTAVRKISETAARHASKTLVQKALTKGTVYPLVKKVATLLGVRMTKDVFSKGVSKAIPLVGGALSGGITYATFKPMANRLRVHLASLKWAKSEYYESIPSQDQFVDVPQDQAVEVSTS